MEQWRVASWLIKYGGLVLLTTGVTAAVFLLVVKRDGLVRVKWRAYEDSVKAHCRFLFLPIRGEVFARLQLLAALVLTAAVIVVQGLGYRLLNPEGWGPLVGIQVVVWGVPAFWFKYSRRRRILKLEDQSHRWLSMLGDTIAVVPSLGAAIETTSNRLQKPIAQEVALIVKEHQLGVPIDRAVEVAAERSGSSVFKTSTVCLVVANRRGGDMSRVLKRTAASIREDLRLARLLRTQTSPIRREIFLLAAVPVAVLVGMIVYMPMMADILLKTETGNNHLTAAAACWFGGLYLARTAMRVEL